MSNLSCGIVGLPNVGKSTLFQALTKKTVAAENFPFCTIDPNLGLIPLYDPRLEKLSDLSNSHKLIYASVSFVDIAGLVKGASAGEGLGNQFLTHIRQTDAIIEVVRCFDDENIIHVSGKIDPLEDAETIHLELTLADLQMAENILAKLEKQLKGNKELSSHIDLMKKVIAHLNEEKALRTLELNEDEELILENYAFLTRKKILYVANVHESDLPEMENEYVKILREHAEKEGSSVICICSKIEQELAALEPEEAKEFLQDLGLKESGLDRLAKEAFSMLGLITFLTTGEIETRAWTIKQGMTAQEAAGKIHTDISKGFIRAEVVSYEDMLKYGGRVGAREAGKARAEGRGYIVKDGDVILFFHN